MLYVHLPGIGATPIGANEYGRNVHFADVMGADVDFDSAWKLLDDVDAFLSQAASTKFGMRYGEAGLQVMFDASSRARYADAVTSESAFEAFLHEQSELEDRLTNMEW